MGERVRVVLVDDQALLRAGIGTILSAHPDLEVVGEASTGAEAVRVVRQTRPDVVCMDVQMPDMDGLEATRRITADPEVQAAVVVLTTFNREDYLLEALRAGAVGYLLKTSRPEQLHEAVLSAAAGEGLLAPEVTRAVIARAVDARPTPTSTAAPLVPLTEREAEVLVLVARGLNNDEIAAELVVSRATVKTHVSNVLAKLGLRDRVQAVVYAHEHGLTG
ncbi:response regulator [Cellulomonas shaoxiangyii]|uniref:Response regulator transcription factor n=1 Tax=Cellulomonas shaoxiangyii TaxID=2566013 RepID=A0A4P7SLQ2_9CELL|nr:response regulator transcription factor [Cellulomonas shaoxiangyii]QCB94457.1 response regulator transcription factor [Cellulomonas shaoxiangyii]TGY85138.1 response regulator transcription factor [Cellulomonas shaoxiangyii]